MAKIERIEVNPKKDKFKVIMRKRLLLIHFLGLLQGVSISLMIFNLIKEYYLAGVAFLILALLLTPPLKENE